DSGHGRGRTGRAARDRRDGRPGAARDRQARRRAARAPGALGRRACCHHGAGVTPTTATDTLVVATGNRGKLEELRALLADLPWRVLGVSEVLAEPPLVVEDGETFADNALKKARAVAGATITPPTPRTTRLSSRRSTLSPIPPGSPPNAGGRPRASPRASGACSPSSIPPCVAIPRARSRARAKG